jgi:acyl-CoA synthetase (AMP-forming)/AMP-acid ligase II
MTIANLLLRSAQLWGDQPALIDAADGRSICFSQLFEASLYFGHALRRRGLVVGDRVAILGDATPAYLIADYGSMAVGLVRVPLDPSLSADDLASQIRDAEARLLLFDESCAMLAAQIVEKTKVESSVLDARAFDHPSAGDNVGLPADPDIGLNALGLNALASLNYTGGTSGQPKAVMLSHGNLRAIVQNIVMARDMGPGDVLVNVRPLWPIAAIIVLAHLAAGGTVVLGGRFEPLRMVALLDQYRAAATSMVPTHLVRVLRDCPPSQLRALTKLRSIDIGAASIPSETFEQAIDAFGPKIGVLYGLTEASWSCYQPPSMFEAVPHIRNRLMHSVGRPVFGCDIMIAGDSGPVPHGQPGEILIRGAHVMKGYWKRPDLTAEVLKNDWFATGDLGIVNDDGIVAVIGRIKETIRTGGKTVLPKEVEATLCRHPGVAEASVVGISDKEWGELVTALVVLAPGAGVSEADLKDHCTTSLSAHKRPKFIRIVAELPKSHYGKIQRGKVRDAVTELYRRGAAGSAPRDT